MRAALICAALALPAAAQEAPEVEAFMEGNVLSIFYHELGHALIDVEDVPIFGQEEDAADVFAVIMAETIWNAGTALELAYDFALLFDVDARARAEAGDAPAWWDVHGPDEQRFYNTVCLFYGADPAGRADYAADMDLPADRAESCSEEFDQALAAWGDVLDTVTDRGPGRTIALTRADEGQIGTILTEEVAALNDMLQLSQSLAVRVEPCGEANAFYDPAEIAVIFCTEYEAELVASGRDVHR